MALSKKSVNKAISILRKIDTALPVGIVTDKGPHNQNPRVFGRDRKSDGGWESVFIYINNPTKEQLELFETLKNGISNTPFVRAGDNGSTKLGWF